MSDRVTSPPPDAPAGCVVVADGATGATPHTADPAPDDFAGHEGRAEVLDVTGPDVVRRAHRGCPEAGAGAVETDASGANPPHLAERGSEDRISEPSRRGAEPASEAADGVGGRVVLAALPETSRDLPRAETALEPPGIDPVRPGPRHRTGGDEQAPAAARRARPRAAVGPARRGRARTRPGESTRLGHRGAPPGSRALRRVSTGGRGT